MSDRTSEINTLLNDAYERGLHLARGALVRRVPAHVQAAEEAERTRLRQIAETRERAQAAGWPGPYRVQVPANDRVVPEWTTWLDRPNAMDRRFTAEARARALVHGLRDDLRPGWYGDQRSELGAHERARVIDAAGRVIYEVER